MLVNVRISVIIPFLGNDTYLDLGGSDTIVKTISALYSGITDSNNETLICTQGSPSNAITKSVQNSSGYYDDVLYDAYLDIPLYKYDDAGCLYVLKDIKHYMKGKVNCNVSSMEFAAGFYHKITIIDNTGIELGAVNNSLGTTNITGTTFTYNDTATLSVFDYGISTDIVRIRVTTTLKFALVSGSNEVVSQTGAVNNNDFLSVTYLKQPNP